MIVQVVGLAASVALSTSTSRLMRLVAAFQERFPLVQIAIDSDNTEGVVRKILDGTTDVAIAGVKPDDPRLFARHLGSHEVVLFVNDEHPWAELSPVKLAQLDGQRIITREPGSMTRTAIERSFAEHGVKPVIAMELSRDAVREAVFEGLGIGITSVSEFRAHHRLRVLRIADHPAYTHSYLLCLRARRHLQPFAAFADLAERTAMEPVDAR